MPGGKRDDEGPDLALTAIAQETGAKLHAYPRPGKAVRRVILQDSRDDTGTKFEAAVIEDDSTLRISGHDSGRTVSDFFGPGITSYEWVYVVSGERVSVLRTLLGADEGSDLLQALTVFYQRHRGQLHTLLTRPEVGADFSNWHS